MAFSVNRVTIVGRLGNDAEFKSFQNGGGVVNLRVATSESWKDRNTGERKERTEWHTVQVFAKWLIDDAQKLRKGDMVMVEGKQQTRKWQDQSGNDRYSTETVVQGMEHALFCITPKARGGSGGGERQQDGGGGQSGGDNLNRGGGGWNDGGTTNRSGGGGFADDLDDDIPF